MSVRNESRIIIANKNKHVCEGLKATLAALHHSVLFTTDNERELVSKLKQTKRCTLILDVSLKAGSAFHLIKRISQNYPEVTIIMLSEFTHPYTVMYMIQYGAKAFLPLDAKSNDLSKALKNSSKQIHNNKLVSRNMIKSIQNGEVNVPSLSDKQISFLHYCCSELSYAEIAVKMKVSLRTVDWYRDVMFNTFKLNNRVDLVLFALKTGLISLQ